MKNKWPICLLAAFSAGLATNADLARLEREIGQLQRDVEAERQMLEADRGRLKSWEAGAAGQLEDMRVQARRARAEADSLSRLLQGLNTPSRDRARDQQRLQEESSRFAREAAAWSDSVLAKVRREELPENAEALERRLRDVSRGLRAGILPPDQGLGQILDLVSSLIDQGRKVEARPGTYTTLDGRPMEGHFVTAGGFFEAFVSVDGGFGAYRAQGSRGWEWKEYVPANRRENLLKISRMLQAGEEPGFVPLPFGLVSGGLP